MRQRFFCSDERSSTARTGRKLSRVGSGERGLPLSVKEEAVSRPPFASKPITPFLPAERASAMPAMTKGEPTFVRTTSKEPLASMPELDVTGVTTTPAPRKLAVMRPMRSPRSGTPLSSASRGRSPSPSAETMASRLCSGAHFEKRKRLRRDRLRIDGDEGLRAAERNDFGAVMGENVDKEIARHRAMLVNTDLEA